MKKPTSQTSTFDFSDFFLLIASWTACATLSGVVLFEPLRQVLEPVVLNEAADRIDSKIRLAEIALETRTVDELPSTPEVLKVERPPNASEKLNENDLQLVSTISELEGVQRKFLVAQPTRDNWPGGYWILLDVKNNTSAHWLYSRNSIALSSWFLPIWRSFLLVIGLLVGTLLFLRFRLTQPLDILLKSMEQGQGNHLDLIQPKGMRPIRSVIIRINELYEQINANSKTRQNLMRSISHDLRAPLTRLHVLMELEQNINPNQIRADLNLLKILSDEISTLSEDLADASESQIFSLDKFCRRIISSYPSNTIVIQNCNFIIRLNQDMLQRTLHNIIDNSLEYGKPPVTISGKRIRDRLEITIDDSGQGIDTNTLLTMPYINRSNDRGQQRHSGLGLQMAETFCRMNGGQMLLKSAPSGGLRVVLSLCAAVIES